MVGSSRVSRSSVASHSSTMSRHKNHEGKMDPWMPWQEVITSIYADDDNTPKPQKSPGKGF